MYCSFEQSINETAIIARVLQMKGPMAAQDSTIQLLQVVRMRDPSSRQGVRVLMEVRNVATSRRSVVSMLYGDVSHSMPRSAAQLLTANKRHHPAVADAAICTKHPLTLIPPKDCDKACISDQTCRPEGELLHSSDATSTWKWERRLLEWS